MSALVERVAETRTLLRADFLLLLVTLIPASVGCGHTAAPETANRATISADPNPVPAGAEKHGKTLIAWDTGDGTLGQVFVSVNGGEERRFSGALPRGTHEASWIGKGEYEFRLYAGKEHTTRLASVIVRRNNE